MGVVYFSSSPPSSLTSLRILLLVIFVSSSFFVVFVVFIPRNDRDVVYMCVLETFGGFVGFFATGLRRFEHMRQRWVQRL